MVESVAEEEVYLGPFCHKIFEVRMEVRMLSST